VRGLVCGLTSLVAVVHGGTLRGVRTAHEKRRRTSHEHRSGCGARRRGAGWRHDIPHDQEERSMSDENETPQPDTDGATTPETTPGPPETDLHNEKVDETPDERFDAG